MMDRIIECRSETASFYNDDRPPIEFITYEEYVEKQSDEALSELIGDMDYEDTANHVRDMLNNNFDSIINMKHKLDNMLRRWYESAKQRGDDDVIREVY